jgi:Nitrile hydratase beta subunit
MDTTQDTTREKVHDLGGRAGMGPIDIDPDQPIFHAEWERRIFGMFILAFAGGHFNIDEFRWAIEKMEPSHYLESHYYEHWLYSLEHWCKANGSLTDEEITARMKELAAGEA